MHIGGMLSGLAPCWPNGLVGPQKRHSDGSLPVEEHPPACYLATPLFSFLSSLFLRLPLQLGRTSPLHLMLMLSGAVLVSGPCFVGIFDD